jgi:hypothetical protein
MSSFARNFFELIKLENPCVKLDDNIVKTIL